MRISTLDIAKLSIVSYFSGITPLILKNKEIFNALSTMRTNWHLASAVSPTKFVNYLIKEKIFNKIVFNFPNRREMRFVKGKVDIYQVLSTLNNRGYLSHLTALELNNLSSERSMQLFWNVEQRKKILNSRINSQDSIDTAFRNKSRTTHNICEYNGYMIYGISGMFTDNLGVIEKDNIRYTDLERTLIDIMVRPQYSGGIINVLKIFGKAKERVRLKKLTEYYKKIKYVYPYHQSIGFYLERTNYPIEFIDTFSKIKKRYNFYLDNQIAHPKYSKKWQLYYPSELDKIKDFI